MGFLTAHGGGVLVLALGMVVEGAGVAELVEKLPQLWATVAGPLCLVGAALTCFRARSTGAVLALGCMGAGPGRLLIVAGLSGMLWTLPAERVLGQPAVLGETWERVSGGWVKQGATWKEPGQVLGTRVTERVRGGGEVVVGMGAGVLGGWLGLFAGSLAVVSSTGLVLVGQGIVRGLVERGRLGEESGVVMGVVLLVGVVLVFWSGALFPSRSR